MTPNQIASAYRGILELSHVVLPYKVARRIADLKKRLEAENDTVAEMEKNLAKEYGGTLHADGSCDFPDPETARKFNDELNEIRKQDDDIQLPKVDLTKYSGMIRISPAAIEGLAGIVVFDEGDSDG